ncbi:MAG: hypothetical protein EP330_21375 [Deltaproteobacteria bacterium]|nr:MAG: hypothetical protein EP330_21375 [Deltaproteobacteria bacterium]
MRTLVFLSLVACASADSSAGEVAKSAASTGFWDHWGDGQAELAGYALVQPRYGELRQGTAVHVTVTEDFTRGDRVKSEGGHGDEYPVVKLNAVRDFQTGIYDYNLLTSVFLPLDGSMPRGQPTKLSFSGQEWCGHVYDQLIVDPGKAQWTGHSYFDGEADRTKGMSVPEDAVFEDAMPLLGRDLAGRVVGPGESVEVPWLRAMLDHRFAHEPLALTTATLTRSTGTRELTVPAGTFTVYDLTATLADGSSTTWSFEQAAPHRLIAWQGSDGEAGKLTGSVRDPYWAHHGNADAKLREALNLPE